MPSETISGYTLTKVKNALKKGNAKNDTYYDKDTTGLAIKVTPTGASWYLSTRDVTRKIADLSSYGVEDIPALRALVVSCKQEIARARDVRPLIEAFVAGHSLTDAKNLHNVAHGEGVVWEQARDKFLEWIQENRKKDTARCYKSALGATAGLAADFAHLNGKPIASITHADLTRVRNNIVTRCKGLYGKGHGIRQAKLTVQVLKSAFSHFADECDMGLEVSPAAALKPPKETSEVNDNEHMEPLTQIQLGALWHGLLCCRNEQARLVLQLQLLTGQRRYTATSALKDRFQMGGAYDCLWGMEDKVHHWRKLPLPPVAASVVEQAMRLTREGNGFLFPIQRPRRSGDDMSGHINERTVSYAVEAMHEPGGVFENMPFSVSTHDSRRAFTTVMTPKMAHFRHDGRQMLPAEVAIITHLNEGRASVSQKIYDRNAYVDVKLEILTWWQDYVMEGYRMYLAQQELKRAA